MNHQIAFQVSSSAQSSLQAAAIIRPSGMSKYEKLSNLSQQTCVSNTSDYSTFPFTGLITTICKPRSCPLSLGVHLITLPPIDILAKFPPLNPADSTWTTRAPLFYFFPSFLSILPFYLKSSSSMSSTSVFESSFGFEFSYLSL